MRILVVILLTVSSLLSQAQWGRHSGTFSRDNAFWYSGNSEDSLATFSSIRPYHVPHSPENDSLFADRGFSISSGDHTFRVLPLLENRIQTDFSDAFHFTSNGVALGYQFSDKLWAEGYATYNHASFMPFLDSIDQAIGQYPSFGPDMQTRQGGFNWGGSVIWNTGKFFLLEAGRQRNSFGDGYRSLLLSEYAPEYPFLRIQTTLWRFRYVNLFNFMQHRGDLMENSGYEQFRKFSTMHYLCFNWKNKFEIGIFEAVVWQGQDTLLRRGFDINYLNPIIFYRPVEFSLGSSDNALIGLNIRYSPRENVSVYGQLMLDEFFLREIRQDLKHLFRPNDTTVQHGWWANKYGFQLGVKAHEPFGIDGLSGLFEFNMVRPYTFTHGSVYQSYSHNNHSLSHPLGANFREWVAMVQYRWGRFRVSNRLIAYKRGGDEKGVNYGGNILLSYAGRPSEYYHEIGQGASYQVVSNELMLSWFAWPDQGVEVRLGWLGRSQTGAGSLSQNFLTLGIRSSFLPVPNDL